MRKLSLIVMVIVTALFSSNQLIQADGTVNFEMFDKCKNVSFRVTNNRNVAIEVKQVKYYNASKGKWKTEDITDASERCERGSTCIIGGNGLINWKGEDLADAEGDRLTKIVFVFKDVNSSTTHESQQFSPTDPVCRVEKEYGHGQGWTISGTSDANSQNSSDGLGDECKNVSFLVKNSTRNSAIYITKVKYFNRNSGNWKTENVSEVSCQMGETCTIGGQDDLADAKDDDITKISFIYNYYLDGSFKKSANKESKVFNPSSPKCTEGKIYGTGQGWIIGESSPTNTSSTNPVTTSTSSGSTSTDPNPSNSPVVNVNSDPKSPVNPKINQPTTTVVQGPAAKPKQKSKKKKP